MAGRDYDAFLAALRLHREQIQEAVVVMERLVKSEKFSGKPASWARVGQDHDEGQDHDHITYKQMLYTLQQNRLHVEEAIFAIGRLARSREGATLSSAKLQDASPAKRNHSPTGRIPRKKK